ncbi:cation:proton antiporter [Clostridium sp. FP1]|uniref:cation:proton antiporter n=1 Tax=Clostridium sp. FP1 TaxID=2724076 RepID=UPI0013E909A6|nr:cation:proton antiporter [Clostridium sp. FP1]MBZ9633894.1 cation:proton antiporter [Clostridium sp. FP1]
MLEINFLIDLAIILLSTKVLGLITKKIHMPQVVGALLAGLILGPSMLGIIHETDFISKMAELGVIVLMFSAGLETDMKELKKCGKASLIIAIIGVILPLIGGFAVAAFYNNSGQLLNMSTGKLLENIFIGVVLTATSVSITVETLQELGTLKTRSGTAILGAAVIDDVIGIVILTIITSLANSSVNIGFVLFKIIVFFVITVIIGIIFYYVFNKLSKFHGPKRRISIYGLVFCLLMAFMAERYFGIADITGAYIAGIIISTTCESRYVSIKIDTLSYLLLSPIFFANIGIKTTISTMDAPMIIFTIVLLIVAILTKIIGCGLGAKVCKYTSVESIRIGIGMISRGEVALIVANVGVAMNLMSDKFFGPVIIVVIATTLITPILLKFAYLPNRNLKPNFQSPNV